MMDKPPNYRRGKCCGSCTYGITERDRCGDYNFYCDKYRDVDETGLCDDYEMEE